MYDIERFMMLLVEEVPYEAVLNAVYFPGNTNLYFESYGVDIFHGESDFRRNTTVRSRKDLISFLKSYKVLHLRKELL